jgi:uncharacterized protein YacL (UPF0231 family)
MNEMNLTSLAFCGVCDFLVFLEASAEEEALEIRI